METTGSAMATSAAALRPIKRYHTVFEGQRAEWRLEKRRPKQAGLIWGNT